MENAILYLDQSFRGSPGNLDRVTVKVEQQKEEIICYGDPRYLDIIHKLLIERRKLLGLYAPEKREISGNVSFEQLLMQTGIIEDEKE